MSGKTTETEAKEIMKLSGCCSMAVLGELAEVAGISKELAYRISGCFCGGMGMNGACGAVTGAYMALGLKFGGNFPENRPFLMDKRKAFNEAFIKETGALTCLELLQGLKNNDPEDQEKIKALGLKETVCPRAVAAAINIASDMIREG